MHSHHSPQHPLGGQTTDVAEHAAPAVGVMQPASLEGSALLPAAPPVPPVPSLPKTPPLALVPPEPPVAFAPPEPVLPLFCKTTTPVVVGLVPCGVMFSCFPDTQNEYSRGP